VELPLGKLLIFSYVSWFRQDLCVKICRDMHIVSLRDTQSILVT
jgi:hypothetical protein